MPMQEPSLHHFFHKNGTNKMQQNGPALKLLLSLILIAFLCASYFIGDITSTRYMEIIQKAGNFKVFDKSPYFNYLNGTITTFVREGYLVWSPSCRIPDINPMHESIKQFVKKRKPVKCSQHPPLTSLTRNSSGYTLHLHKMNFKKYSKNLKVFCCYSFITRGKLEALQKLPTKDVDDIYSVGKCRYFNESLLFNGNEEFIKINCSTKKGNTNKAIYSNMHAMTTGVGDVNLSGKNISQTGEKPSIMLIGIDSISRLNLIRAMPKTVEHLKKNGWVEYKGYNKIDDNTFPNLMAILTGHTVRQIREKCWSKPTKNLNDCPLIWYDFSSQGYATAYGEDEPSIATFNYHKAGFLQQPTDFYLRPYMLAAEKYLPKKVQSGLNLCVGPICGADHVMNYLIDFAKTCSDKLSFSLFWMNSFSHNDLNDPSSMDDRIRQFLMDLNKTGALNNTLVIFLSDHGMRFGSIRETYVGWLEERLPFLYFKVPDFYKNNHPQKYHNLKINADRLTSPFDLHLTLKDIMGFPTNGSLGCIKCQSLFDEVPWNRSCQDVAVTEHWCTCSEYKSVPTDRKIIQEMVRFVLKELNGALKNGSQFLNNGTKCAELKVKKILSVRSKVFAHSIGHEEYVILFETSPNEALFEATVKHKQNFQLIDTVSRINSYGSQSKCMNDAYLQKYCYCL